MKFVSDSGSNAILIFLDLRAAFSTIDPTILLNHLELWVDIKGKVVHWFSFDLTHGMFSVSMAHVFPTLCSCLLRGPSGLHLWTSALLQSRI